MLENLIKLSEIKSKEDFEKVLVKEYLGFSIKKVMINNILEFCKIPQNNLIKIDYALLEVVKVISIITQYTNIEIPEDIVFAYDYLIENKILEYVLDKINKDEIIFIDDVLNFEIKQINNIDNSLQGVLSKSLNHLIEKIPDEKAIKSLSKSIVKDINKLDAGKINELKNMFKIISKK